METYGFPPAKWESAKDEARAVMIKAARAEGTISYADIVEQIKSITFRHHDFSLFHLLGQISSSESAEGRGMLTSVVVRQEDGYPGQGFFDLARELGLDSSDREAFWVSELRIVYSAWK